LEQEFKSPGSAFRRGGAQAFVEEMMTVFGQADWPMDGRRPGDCPCWTGCGDKLLLHFKRWNGHCETADPASGCHNLAHVAATALYLWMLEQQRAGRDDRPGSRAQRLLADLGQH